MGVTWRREIGATHSERRADGPGQSAETLRKTHCPRSGFRVIRPAGDSAVAKELIARRMIDGVEALRQVKAQLPIGTYLHLLHVAAVTGRLPKLDPWTFKPVLDLAGQETYNEVDVADRIKILGGLVDKVVPDAKVSDTPQGTQDPALLLKQDLSRLPREDLLRIISQAGAALESPVEPE